MLFLPYSPSEGLVRVSQKVGGNISHQKNSDNFFYTGIDFSLGKDDLVLSMGYGEIVSIYDEAIDFTSENTVEKVGKSLVPVNGAEASIGDGGLGNYVTVLHTVEINGQLQQFYATYAHLEQHSTDHLEVGDIVFAGTEIGEVGWTGKIIGDHLHVHVGLDLNVKDEANNYAYADGRPGTSNPDLKGAAELTNDGLIDLISFDYGGKGATYKNLSGSNLSFNGVVYDGNLGSLLSNFKFPSEKAADEGKEKSGQTETTYIIDFEDAPGVDRSTDNNPLPDGYLGANWDNIFVFDPDAYGYVGTGYNALADGSDLIAYNAFGDIGFASTDEFDFDLVSGDFIAAWNDGLTLKIYGYDDGEMVAEETLLLTTEAPLRYYFGSEFESIDKVVFESFGGTPVGEFDGTHFAMDDLTVVTEDQFLFT